MESNGRSGGLLVCWADHVTIHSVITTQFCIEMECSSVKSVGKFWAVFVYTSTDIQIKQQQWDFLIQERSKWGDEWFIGGDFNDIRDYAEKRGGRRRSDLSFRNFNNFISNMEMSELKAVGSKFT